MLGKMFKKTWQTTYGGMGIVVHNHWNFLGQTVEEIIINNKQVYYYEGGIHKGLFSLKKKKHLVLPKIFMLMTSKSLLKSVVAGMVLARHVRFLLMMNFIMVIKRCCLPIYHLAKILAQ